MTNHLKTLIAGAAMLMAVALPAAASDGVVTVKSDYSVAETVARIKKDVLKKGIMFFGVIDQARLGNKVIGHVLLAKAFIPAGSLDHMHIGARARRGLRDQRQGRPCPQQVRGAAPMLVDDAVHLNDPQAHAAASARPRSARAASLGSRPTTSR